jgi:hypothetical protein
VLGGIFQPLKIWVLSFLAKKPDNLTAFEPIFILAQTLKFTL